MSKINIWQINRLHPVNNRFVSTIGPEFTCTNKIICIIRRLGDAYYYNCWVKQVSLIGSFTVGRLNGTDENNISHRVISKLTSCKFKSY